MDNYTVENPSQLIEVAALPTFSNTDGVVVLLNIDEEVIDELNYDASWHFALIDNSEGVSLERIDFTQATQDASNWHSAATSAGNATLTYKNSQIKIVEDVSGATISVTPKVFSPDNDGYNDVLSITYYMDEPGYVANVSIFDAAGRPIKKLVQNQLLGTSGYWNWDGLDDKYKKLPIGFYIIYTEIFNLEGKKKHFKNVITLARHLD